MLTMYAFEWIAVFVEAFGYLLAAVLLATGSVDLWASLSMYAASQVLGVLISVSAVHSATHYLNVYRGPSNVIRLLAWAVLGQFGYRQLTLFWRIRSFFGGSTQWGAMPRTGFGTAA